MPLVHECAHEGCDVLTMSLYCLKHEQATETLTAELLDAASSAADGAREPDDS